MLTFRSTTNLKSYNQNVNQIAEIPWYIVEESTVEKEVPDRANQKASTPPSTSNLQAVNG